jgi:hypothetical protein
VAAKYPKHQLRFCYFLLAVLDCALSSHAHQKLHSISHSSCYSAVCHSQPRWHLRHSLHSHHYDLCAGPSSGEDSICVLEGLHWDDSGEIACRGKQGDDDVPYDRVLDSEMGRGSPGRGRLKSRWRLPDVDQRGCYALVTGMDASV